MVVRGIPPDQAVVAEGSLLLNDVMADLVSDAGGPTPAEVKPMPANGDPATPQGTPRPL